MAALVEFAPDIPDARGAFTLGAAASGEPVTVPFFTAGRGTRGAMIGDPTLPRAIALRALEAGARLRVVTPRPAGWLGLRGGVGIYTERLTVVSPGARVLLILPGAWSPGCAEGHSGCRPTCRSAGSETRGSARPP